MGFNSGFKGLSREGWRKKIGQPWPESGLMHSRRRVNVTEN